MEQMPDFDLTTPAGKQAFKSWLVNVVRNEVNSYTRQVLAQANTGETVASGRIKVT